MNSGMAEAENDRNERRGGYRRTIDPGSGLTRYMNPSLQSRVLEPDQNYIINLAMPKAFEDNVACSLTTKFIHSSANKNKQAITSISWTSDGRRLLTASTSGEFTLWNGMSFNFEQLTQAHDKAVRAMRWTPNGDWLLSADDDGVVKYWQPTMHNLKIIKAHQDPVRDLAISPNGSKFVSASDDLTLKIWNFNEGIEERKLQGHRWDVKCVDWHPSKGLIVSGSKDNSVRFWDPRSSRCLGTLHGHKNTVNAVRFQPTRGDLLCTTSRDQTARVFEMRVMRDIKILRGREKDVTTVAWHPLHPNLITTGGTDGAILHYILDDLSTPLKEGALADDVVQSLPSDSVPYAHESGISSMAYHPLGHLLATASNDRSTRFWGRARPGDPFHRKDKYHLGEELAEKEGLFRQSAISNLRQVAEEVDDEANALIDQQMPISSGTAPLPLPLPPIPPEQFRQIHGHLAPLLGGQNFQTPPGVAEVPGLNAVPPTTFPSSLPGVVPGLASVPGTHLSDQYPAKSMRPGKR